VTAVTVTARSQVFHCSHIIKSLDRTAAYIIQFCYIPDTRSRSSDQYCNLSSTNLKMGVLHDQPRCFVCPDLLVAVGETFFLDLLINSMLHYIYVTLHA
jgi:hypothetical protein